MTKSLLNTPPSGLSSRPAALHAALVAGARVRKAGAKGNGSVVDLPRRRGDVGVRDLSRRSGEAAVRALSRRDGDAGEADRLAARVRLLEGFIGRTHIADVAPFALQGVADGGRVTRSICLVLQPGEQSLNVVGAHGLASSSVGSFSISVDDWANPLVIAFTNREPTVFAAPATATDRKRR